MAFTTPRPKSKPDSLEAIKYQKMLMIMTGMWPLDNRTIFYKFKNIVVLSINLFGTLFIAVELYVQLNNIDVFTNIGTIWMSLVCTVVKNFIYEFKRSTFKQVLTKLKEPIFDDYPDELNIVMEETTSKSMKISGFYQGACLFSLTTLLAVQYFTWPVIPLYPVTFIEITPMRSLLVHILETVTMVLCACNNSCLDTVSGGFITIGTGYLKILNAKIKNVKEWTQKSDEIDQELVNRWLSDCVKQHIALLNFIELVEKNFNIGYLVQFCGSIIVICNIGFQMVHAPELSHFLRMVLYFVAMMTQLCLYCWLGNELSLESVNTMDSCYLSGWVDYDAKVRKTLFIIMERSKRPVFLTAGKFANLSLDSFKSILKSSYSYFALMQTLYQESEPAVM